VMQRHRPMPNFIPATGCTLHLVAVWVNRIGKDHSFLNRAARTDSLGSNTAMDAFFKTSAPSVRAIAVDYCRSTLLVAPHKRFGPHTLTRG
jgi:hypothetical protein